MKKFSLRYLGTTMCLASFILMAVSSMDDDSTSSSGSDVYYEDSDDSYNSVTMYNSSSYESASDGAEIGFINNSSEDEDY